MHDDDDDAVRADKHSMMTLLFCVRYSPISHKHCPNISSPFEIQAWDLYVF